MRSLAILLLICAGCETEPPTVYWNEASKRNDLLQDIHVEVAEDAIVEYQMVVRQGDPIEICVHAGMVAASFLQAQDEANYTKWKNTENVWIRQSSDSLQVLRKNILDYFKYDKDAKEGIVSRLAEVSARDETCEVTTYQRVYKEDYMLRPIDQHRIVLGYKAVREWQERLKADIVSHWRSSNNSLLKCDVVFVLGTAGVWCIIMTVELQSLNCLTTKFFEYYAQ